MIWIDFLMDCFN